MKKQIKNLTNWGYKPLDSVLSKDNSLAWVAKAASSDTTRTIINLVRVETDPTTGDNIAIGTDGCRLHKLTEVNLEPGHYTIEKQGSKIHCMRWDVGEQNFPNWRQVIPHPSNYRVSGDRNMHLTQALYTLANAGVMIDPYKFAESVKDGVGMAKYDELIRLDPFVHASEPGDHPIYLTNDPGRRFVVIMPVRQRS